MRNGKLTKSSKTRCSQNSRQKNLSKNCRFLRHFQNQNCTTITMKNEMTISESWSGILTRSITVQTLMHFSAKLKEILLQKITGINFWSFLVRRKIPCKLEGQSSHLILWVRSKAKTSLGTRPVITYLVKNIAVSTKILQANDQVNSTEKPAISSVENNRPLKTGILKDWSFLEFWRISRQKLRTLSSVSPKRIH